MRTVIVAVLAWVLVQPAALRPQTATDIHLIAIAKGLDGLAGTVPQPLAVARGYENQPHFDPDGQRVLYTANLDGRQTDIYEFDRRTRATRQLTRTSEGEYSPTIPRVRPSAASLAREGFTTIRVEADGTQRLWQFDREGRNPALVLTEIKPVGYHAWIDADRLALYVLGSPATLQLARVSTGKGETLLRDIGRTLRVIPGTSHVSVVQRVADQRWTIMEVDPATGRADSIVATVEGSLDRDYEWMPDGRTLLMSAGTKVMAWTRGAAGWRDVLDMSMHGLGTVSRLAVSPNGDALALVTAERP
jgi:Tol biopolymer transport system component